MSESLMRETSAEQEQLPRYPKVKVRLTGKDGNAFAILGRVSEALKKAGVSDEERASFRRQAMSGSYQDLLCVCADWVRVS